MIRTVIIDHEKEIIKALKALIGENHSEFRVVADYLDYDKARAEIAGLRPDLVILSTEINGELPTTFLSELQNERFDLILLTNGLKTTSIELRSRAVDLITKPVSSEQIGKVFNGFLKYRHYSKAEARVSRFSANGNGRNEKPHADCKIALKTAQKVHIVGIHEIIRCEADKNYTYFFLSDGSKITISKTLNEYAKLLENYQFIRPHKSHLVNLQHIRTVNKQDGGSLIMRDKSVVPISFRRKEQILKKINEIFLHC
ncbi:MAG: LytTR family DNA-binding domain-containing protein [Bacteroidales bacterium]|nr:LytTR family DNA-binding domain-containing protein [Bacteroidales bacterium]MCF8344926.1 LytTR family DNA-binding domain-containing protein [Bacteroidales bacterium]MCF8349952.1 LytTR family DNA-binding domain-containing protein [Bacteroidales bacterium]MCF8375470.1 LytTR family DNA-binding domain-containing protein [Bacteroidales bacterium]MCF8402119.1 LytTR family DNA-binding domain-containing protein [Bacteroidales bacterium]